jgi:hypothetical protein
MAVCAPLESWYLDLSPHWIFIIMGVVHLQRADRGASRCLDCRLPLRGRNVAVEAAPLMETALAVNCVDLDILGDWEDVQVRLGM